MAKLGSLSGSGSEKPAFSFDLDDLGVKFDDIKAVLSIDESTHLLSTALVTLGMEAQGQKLDFEIALPAHQLERAGHVPVRHRLATTIRGVDPDRQWWLRVPAVFLSPKSVFVAMRDESREDVDARSEPVLALTAARRDRDRPGLEHRTHALRRPGIRRPARRRLGGHRRRGHRLRGLLHRRRCSLPRHPRLGERRHVPARPAHPRLSRWHRSRSRWCSSGRSSSRSTAATSSVAAAPTTGRGAFLRPARAGLRRLGSRAASRRCPGRARLDLVALPRRARARRPLPSGVREPPLGLLGLPRRARARRPAWRTCAAPPGSGVREPRPRRCRRRS